MRGCSGGGGVAGGGKREGAKGRAAREVSGDSEWDTLCPPHKAHILGRVGLRVCLPFCIHLALDEPQWGKDVGPEEGLCRRFGDELLQEEGGREAGTPG